jgi:hypothetical protein
MVNHLFLWAIYTMAMLYNQISFKSLFLGVDKDAMSKHEVGTSSGLTTNLGAARGSEKNWWPLIQRVSL